MRVTYFYYVCYDMAKQTNKELEIAAKQVLKNKFLAVADIDKEALQAFVNLLTIETFKKNTLIIREHQTIEYIYFIYKGVIRIFFNKNDKIIIERFEKEGGFFGGNYDHFSKYPSVHNFQSLEDMVVLKIKHADLDNLCKNYHSIEHLYRMLLEAFHYSYVDKLYALKASTSEERYRDFEKEYGDIINRISLRNVASYLGMTSETISRIRARQHEKR